MFQRGDASSHLLQLRFGQVDLPPCCSGNTPIYLTSEFAEFSQDLFQSPTLSSHTAIQSEVHGPHFMSRHPLLDVNNDVLTPLSFIKREVQGSPSSILSQGLQPSSHCRSPSLRSAKSITQKLRLPSRKPKML